MRWTVWACVGGWFAGLSCTADKPRDDTGAPDGDADSDSDSDSDSDADTDTDSDTDLGTALRIVHASAGLADQDLVVNGNLPPVLEDLAWRSSTAYSPRPPGRYTFQLKAAGSALASAWITFDEELLDDRRHTFVIYGPAEAPDVMRLLDDDLSLDPDRVRIRWSHASPALPPVLDLLELGTGALLASDLAYGASIELDLDPVEVTLGLDQDDDGQADLVFQPFQRAAGDYFHVLLVNSVAGEPFLLGQTVAGATPIRDLAP